MRRWFLLLVVLFVLLTIGVYALFPNKVNLRQEINFQANPKAFTRAALDEKTWKEWWPGEVRQSATKSGNDTFLYKGNRYILLNRHLSSQTILVHFEDDSLVSQLFFIPAQADSVTLQWQATDLTSTMPLKRIQRYQMLMGINEDWKTILQTMQRYYADEENVNGISISTESVKDSLLISTIIQTTIAPSTDTVYQLIDNLRTYANSQGAKQTGYPMLNTTRMTADDQPDSYRTQVALPIDRKLTGEGNIVSRRMLGNGKILMAEVKGGPHTIESAFEKMQQFIEDHQHVAPAIPFESLLTDRRNVRDTATWITRIYWPIL